MKRKNPHSETSILSPLVEFLEILSNQGKLRYLRVHPVRPFTKNGKTAFAKVRPSQRGAPDLVVFMPNFASEETVAFIEGKSKTGKLTSNQLEWHDWAKGHIRYKHFAPHSHGDVGAVINWIRERV